MRLEKRLSHKFADSYCKTMERYLSFYTPVRLGKARGLKTLKQAKPFAWGQMGTRQSEYSVQKLYCKKQSSTVNPFSHVLELNQRVQHKILSCELFFFHRRAKQSRLDLSTSK